MRLVSFAAEDFRSINKTPKLSIDAKLTCFLGPNNEGKSNLLRGFAVAMQLLEGARRPVLVRRAGSQPSQKQYAHQISALNRSQFDWVKDFPVASQARRPDGLSKFILEFELTDGEIIEFRATVGSSLNGTLPVEISVGRDVAYFRVLKQGRGANTLSRKAPQIAQFIGRKLEFHYIPAIRTSKQALSVVEEIVENELRTLEGDSAYKRAMLEIAQLQQPVLDRISDALKLSLREFLPDVTKVSVTLSERRRYQAFSRSVDLLIDDGVPTELAAKGDGVQSLAAISLLRHAISSGARGRSLVLAIEEPESHIHPGAMHRLREVIDDLSNSHQVLLTTHNPIFVQRRSTEANILIERQKARPAQSIDEIRRKLGIRVSDNLRNSECALLVEGEDDRIALTAILRCESAQLRDALNKNRLGIDTLAGGTNLGYQLSQLRLSVCNVHVFLDADETGRDAVAAAVEQGLITLASVTLAASKDMKNSEFEDLIDPAIYSDALTKKYGPILTSQYFTGHKDKWSGRMKNAFVKMGKPWNKFIEMELKHLVAECVKNAPANALKASRRHIIEALVAALESMLSQ